MGTSEERTLLHTVDAHIQQMFWQNWFAAATGKNAALLATYLRTYEFDVDRVGPNGVSALMEASFQGDAGAVTVLLEHGASPRVESPHGGDSLHQAAVAGHADIAVLLLDAGAAVDSVDERRGGTALTQALVRGHGSLAELLLARGASPWAGRPGFAPFDFAARTGNDAAIDLMLAGETEGWPADWRSRAAWMASVGGALALARRLLEQGADLAWRDPNGRSALNQAAANGVADAVRFLVDAGFDPNEPTDTGWTSLLLAVKNKFVAAAVALLEAGADPNAPEPQGGVVPLMHAAAGGLDELAAALLAHGADRTLRDEQHGRTAADWAEACGHTALAARLRASR